MESLYGSVFMSRDLARAADGKSLQGVMGRKEQELLRAAPVFASAGIDSAPKRLVRSGRREGATRAALPEPPAAFPDDLVDFQPRGRELAEPSRAVVALQAATSDTAEFARATRGKATNASEVFRSVDLDLDLDGDGARCASSQVSPKCFARRPIVNR